VPVGVWGSWEDCGATAAGGAGRAGIGSSARKGSGEKSRSRPARVNNLYIPWPLVSLVQCVRRGSTSRISPRVMKSCTWAEIVFRAWKSWILPMRMATSAQMLGQGPEVLGGDHLKRLRPSCRRRPRPSPPHLDVAGPAAGAKWVRKNLLDLVIDQELLDLRIVLRWRAQVRCMWKCGQSRGGDWRRRRSASGGGFQPHDCRSACGRAC